jgi:5-methyltetrahydrofolate--homocysteine methyltransferase
LINLAEYITKSEKPVLLDGAMGTQLAEAGVAMGGQTTLSHPDTVLEIHRKYLACGVDIIITNTLTMNRVSIESHNVGVDVREVNLTGARLARTAAGTDHYVLGDISSTGKLLKPYGSLPQEEAVKAYKEQAAVLAEGGVDGFIIETMFDLQETLCAIQACKEVSGLPVIASITFNTLDRGGRTIMGNSAQDCARALTAAGASVIGTNCGSLDPLQVAQIVSAMREVSPLPIIAQPNAGKPKMVNGKTTFEMSPSDFASGLMKCFQAGAGLIGGCCGTSPAHIQAVARLLGKLK